MSPVPDVYRAFVAYDLDAMTRAKTPVEARALVPTVFVLFGVPASMPPSASPRSYIVAREAVLGVADDGRFDPARVFTALPYSGNPCVGRVERKVIVQQGDTKTHVEHGAILEGCTPPADAYAMLVIDGAHPDARTLRATAAAAADRPPWSTSPARAVHRFAVTDPVFVVAHEAELEVGTATRRFGSVPIADDGSTPTLVELDGGAVLVTNEAMVTIRGGALRLR